MVGWGPTTAAMNPSALASLLRHALTSLGSVAVWLAARNLITPDQTATVSQAFGSLVDPLSIILGALLSRCVIWLVARVFPKNSGGMPALPAITAVAVPLSGLLAVGAAVVMSSCSGPQMAAYKSITDAVPVTVGTTYHGLQASYSTARGIVIYYDADGEPVAKVPARPVISDK